MDRSPLQSLLAAVRLARPQYALTVPLSLPALIYYARGGDMYGQWGSAACAAGALALVMAGAYVLNDLFDLPADRINAPGRALPSGRVSPPTARAFGMGSTGLGLALALACRREFLVVLLVVVGVLVLYNTHNKRMGLGKIVCVAALMTSTVAMALAQAGPGRAASLWVLAPLGIWVFLTSFTYELYTDLQDIAGDRAMSDRPAPWQTEPQRWRRIADAALLGGLPFVMVPMWFGRGVVYAALVLLAAVSAGLAVASPLRRGLIFVYAELVLVTLAAIADGWLNPLG